MDLPLLHLVLASSPIVLYLLYRSLHPRPIPGIPLVMAPGYSSVPWFRGFGREMAKAVREGAMSQFLQDLGAADHLVYQLPLGPAGTWLSRLTGLGTHVVCCADVEEMEDACGRRAASFVRGDAERTTFRVATPRGQITLEAGADLRRRRRVFGVSMAGAYLAKILPRVEGTLDELIALWRTRADAAGGTPFEARQDIILWTVDVGASVAFGRSFDAVKDLHEFVEERPQGIGRASARPPNNQLVDSVFVLMDQIARSLFGGPLAPLMTWYYTTICKRTRKARAHLVHLIDSRIAAERARRRIGVAATKSPQGGTGGRKKATDAEDVLGIVLDAEAAEAAKGEHAPLPHDDLRDELLSFIIASTETTTTMLSWTVKLLAREPAVQHRLRAELAARLPAALTEAGGLTYETVQDEAALPYLHAVVWEAFRVTGTAGVIVRSTVGDATVLGHPVPPGTKVVFMAHYVAASNADGYHKERADAATKEGRRGDAPAPRKYGWWQAEGIEEFRPERWLERAEDGSETFNRNAGPLTAFGAGQRGCFGKNLGLLDVKVAIAKLVGAFFFDTVPAELDTDGVDELISRRPVDTYVRLKPYSC